MSQYLNEYLRRKSILDRIIVGSKWKDVITSFTITKIDKEFVYYKYGEFRNQISTFCGYIKQYCSEVK